MIDYFTRSFSLFRYESGKWHCLKCMVVHENHPNVLQYKESEWIRVQKISYAMTCPKICIRTNICLHEFSGYCDPIESGWSSQNLLNYESASDLVDGLCASIEGDSALYFMYRIQSSSGLVITTTWITLRNLTDGINSLQSTAGIARNGGGGGADCPFQGIYTFSYSTRGGTCAHPPSQTASCTDKSKMVLRYQACPDVAGSESHGKAMVQFLKVSTLKESSRFISACNALRPGGADGWIPPQNHFFT